MDAVEGPASAHLKDTCKRVHAASLDPVKPLTMAANGACTSHVMVLRPSRINLPTLKSVAMSLYNIKVYKVQGGVGGSDE